MIHHEGGCLCGDVRYRVSEAPVRVTICHCTFCQRLTGSAFLVEPVFMQQHVAFTAAAPQIYEHRSTGSGKRVSVHSCARCGVHCMLSFERFPGFAGICAGTFDDPNWFERSAENMRHIFTRSAQKGVVLPAGVPIYREHAIALDGSPNEPIILAEAQLAVR